MFEGLPADPETPLIGAGPTLIAGDFNLDPVRMISAEETAVWDVWVGDGLRFADLNPVGDSGMQYATRRGAFGMAIDRTAMLRFGIPNIRLLFEGDVRVLGQL